MDTTVADPLLGVLIDGRYRIRARIAQGGMATVYSALDERLERMVAVKIIHPGQAHDPHFVDRFTDEAKAIARLTHPNIVSVYDQGRHDGLPYLVMEYVRGRTLRELLTERRRLQPLDALTIAEQMLAAIAAAHRAGLVHRDVKPENVLVTEPPSEPARGIPSGGLVDSVVKVADFGLAQAVEASAGDGGSHLLATVAYVAPELVTDGRADPRTDVYSAGVVLFELLTGRVPFQGDDPVNVAWQHVERTVPAPSRSVPGLPAVLDDLVGRATHRDPARRPSDAGVLLAEVQVARDAIAASTATQVRSLSPPTVVVPQVDAGATAAFRYSGEPPPGHGGEAGYGGAAAAGYGGAAAAGYGGAAAAGYGGAAAASNVDRPSWARLPAAKPAPRGSTYVATRSGRRRRGGLEPVLARLQARLRGDPRARLAAAAALLVLGLLAAVGGWWFGVGRFTDAPSLLNRTRAEAASHAKDLGFRLRFDHGRFHETVPKDTVLGQRPGVGERIVSGGVITVTLSLGPERYRVPDQIVGQQFELAAQDLQRIKLIVKRGDRFDDDVPAGGVVATEPAPGTVVKPNTPITVWVSKGPAPITVPNVVGKDVNDARNTLQGLNLSVDVQNQDSDRPKDQVLSQDPIDGAGVESGAKVTLKVSNGPAFAQIPDVRNQSVDDATRQLQALGLRVRLLGAGTVRLQSPNPGDQVPPGTEVTIFATP